ncbi:hypothetical protein BDV93DRAFT_464266 [Ceratobasidium sp. AG-I]|nr:hypothetical protein BDV93DRAFT_464266 [Ceratobasidium sp. AG-I]
MSNQVLAPCLRALGKRSIVSRASVASLASSTRAASTTTPTSGGGQASSSKSPSTRVLGKPPGFFNPSHPPSSRPRKWPTTPESAELRVLLLRPSSPSNAIYDAYLRLVTNPLHTPLPQPMHQLVLRRVVPPTSSVRLPNFSQQPDSFVIRQEGRLREVVFHMRAAGVEPTIADYHFVLEQMAALGHQRAAYNVYLELVKTGHKPTERTIALTLLALVRRHKMRIFDDHLSAVVAESHGIGERLLGDLLALQNDLKAAPISPMCFDLACRVFKITGSLDKFLAILKSGYGVDVMQPDHRPIEFVERIQANQVRMAASGANEPRQYLQGIPKFSTHTLNTMLDMLGRSRKVREMVSMFEVLTSPLPPTARADAYQYDTWEDDEPEGTSSQSGTSHRARVSDYVPSATPNTASMSFMIKHTVDSYKFDLCKHYLLLAIHLDRQSDKQLRRQLRAALHARQVHADVPATTGAAPFVPPKVDIPRVSVTYEMFTKVWGLANQKAHMRTLRGLVRTVRWLIRRKRRDISVYRAVLEAVPTLAAPRVPNDAANAGWEDDREDGVNGEIPSWLQALVEEQPRPRREFSLASHLALLETETDKLDHFLAYGIRGVEHSSQRIKAELARKKVRKVEKVAAKATEDAEAEEKLKAKKKGKRKEKAEEALSEAEGLLAGA